MVSGVREANNCIPTGVKMKIEEVMHMQAEMARVKDILHKLSQVQGKW